MDISSSPGVRSLQPVPLLVGRALEQILLREELAAVLKGRGRVVLLGGEAGIGKTTLARDLMDKTAAQGIHVLTGACYDLTNTPPYGPWLDLFDACEPGREMPDPPAAFAGGQVGRLSLTRPLFLLRSVDSLPLSPPPVRPSSSSKISIGLTLRAWNSSVTSPRACDAGQSFCSLPIGMTN